MSLIQIYLLRFGEKRELPFRESCIGLDTYIMKFCSPYENYFIISRTVIWQYCCHMLQNEKCVPIENNLDLMDYLFLVANYNNVAIARFHFFKEKVLLWYVYIGRMRKDARQV